MNNFLFTLQFKHSVKDLESSATTIRTAATQVLDSDGLASLLQRLLDVSNAVSRQEAAARGKSDEYQALLGFTLDSLLTVMRKKGSDQKTTLMDAVVGILHDKADEEALSFAGALTKLSDASRLSLGEKEAEVKDLEAKMRKLDWELRTAKKEIDKATEAKEEVRITKKAVETAVEAAAAAATKAEEAEAKAKAKAEESSRAAAQTVSGEDQKQGHSNEMHDRQNQVAMAKPTVINSPTEGAKKRRPKTPAKSKGLGLVPLVDAVTVPTTAVSETSGTKSGSDSGGGGQGDLLAAIRNRGGAASGVGGGDGGGGLLEAIRRKGGNPSGATGVQGASADQDDPVASAKAAAAAAEKTFAAMLPIAALQDYQSKIAAFVTKARPEFVAAQEAVQATRLKVINESSNDQIYMTCASCARVYEWICDDCASPLSPCR